MVEGMALRDALRVSPVALLDRLPEIPEYKRDRAALATAALLSAIRRAVGG
jgi:hypothetical protein